MQGLESTEDIQVFVFACPCSNVSGRRPHKTRLMHSLLYESVTSHTFTAAENASVLLPIF